ncbi:MAG: hypothetical protein HFJ55_01160 [Clostridia bacterium]|jgi:hypothetical protein|nr:hypothetical protein [Clostridia bacterium]
MNGITMGIATARINSLNAPPYYLSPKCFWAWNIMFSDVPNLSIQNLTPIYLSENSMEEAERERIKLKKHFSDNGIDEGDAVAVMFKHDGSIRAIRPLPRDNWIDLEDKFLNKTFMELVSSICKLSQ